jgi:hypothetical protein
MTKLRNKTKSILIVSPYPEGVASGQRLKYQQCFDYLRAYGDSPSPSRLLSQIVSGPSCTSLADFLKDLLDSFPVPQTNLPDTEVAIYDGISIFYSVCLNPRMIYEIDNMIRLAHSNQAK